MRRASLYVLSVFAAVLLAFGCGGAPGASSVTVTFSPTDGSTDVAVDVTVTATFSGAVTAPVPTVSWAALITLKKDNAGDSLCIGVDYDEGTLTATCAHGDLEKGTSYTLTVSGFKDAEGKDIGTATATFTTIGLPTASLKLVRLDSTELDLSSTAIPRAVTIKVTFSRAPDASERTDIESSLVLAQGGTELGRTLAWSTDFTQLTITPDRWFEYGTAYTVDISGALATDVSETFTTVLWGDTNGDGYSDVLVGALYAEGGGTEKGRAYVFLGTAAGVSNCDMSGGCLPDATITGAADNERLGYSVSMAGDVNADGYADILVGTSHAAGTRGEAYILHGSASGIADCDLSAGCTPDARITGAVVGDDLGESVSHAGDVNGDGYDDVIVGALQAGGDKGEAYVYHGSASGIDTTPSSTLVGEVAGDRFGRSVSGAGDVNGDDYDDVIVGAWQWGGAKGRAYVYHGAQGGVGTTPSTTITGAAASDELGFFVSGAGDVNGDGFDDIIVPAYRAVSANGQVYVFNGSSSGISDCDLSGCTPNATITGENNADELGFSESDAGDVNGDGYDDIIVGARSVDGSTGRAYVLNGSGSGIPDCDLSAVTPCTPDATIAGEGAGDDLGFNISMAGDVNDDGYKDVIVGADAVGANKGRAYVLHGSAAGISSRDLATQSANATLTAEDDGDHFGILQNYD